MTWRQAGASAQLHSGAGHRNISYASHMNKTLVVFFKDQNCVTQLIESGLNKEAKFIQVSPLAVASGAV